MKDAWLAALLVLGCHGGPRPCSSPGTCPSGSECLANRCVAQGADPVDPKSRRLVLSATELRVLNGEAEPPGATTPVAVVFGSQRAGSTTLYLRFPRAPAAAGTLDAAFLLLEPVPGTLRPRGAVDLTAYRIAEEWQAAELTHVRRPELGPPSSRAEAHGGPLRVDVTSIVRHLIDHPEQDHGLALVGGGGRGSGVAFATGFGAALGPRLELYVRPR